MSGGFNSLTLGDTIWCHRTWSTWIQVMACGLTSPSHYLSQFWLTSPGVRPSNDILIDLEFQRNFVMLVSITYSAAHSEILYTWWRHQIETFSALLALCVGNSRVTGEFPTQRPVTRSFYVFYDLRSHKRLSKQSWGRWSETPSCSLWCHCNDVMAATISWCVQSFVVTSWAHFKPAYCKFWLNFEFDRNIVSGMGVWALIWMVVLLNRALLSTSVDVGAWMKTLDGISYPCPKLFVNVTPVGDGIRTIKSCFTILV